MIRNFGDEIAAELYRGKKPKGISPDIARKATIRLQMIDAAERIGSLLVPLSNRLKKLSGKLSGWRSLRVNEQYRIIFKWVDGAAEGVEFIDYH